MTIVGLNDDRRFNVELSCCFAQIGFVDDIVAVKDRAGLVATDRHRHALRNPATNHVAHSSASQIVKEQPTEVELLVLPFLRAVAALGLALMVFGHLALTGRTNHFPNSSSATNLRPHFAKITD